MAFDVAANYAAGFRPVSAMEISGPAPFSNSFDSLRDVPRMNAELASNAASGMLSGLGALLQQKMVNKNAIEQIKLDNEFALKQNKRRMAASIFQSLAAGGGLNLPGLQGPNPTDPLQLQSAIQGQLYGQADARNRFIADMGLTGMEGAAFRGLGSG